LPPSTGGFFIARKKSKKTTEAAAQSDHQQPLEHSIIDGVRSKLVYVLDGFGIHWRKVLIEWVVGQFRFTGLFMSLRTK